MCYIFESVEPNEKQVLILYDLLHSRNHSISHTSIPDYESHKKFILSSPYRSWYIVTLGGIPFGSFYLSFDNTIGVNVEDSHLPLVLPEIAEFIKVNYKPMPAITSVRASWFSFNVPPSNKTMQESIMKMGGTLIQLVYKV